MTQVPVMQMQVEDPTQSRSSFLRELNALEEWLASHESASAFEAVGNQHPFYLAYQHENNRDLLARCGKLYSRLMLEWQEKHHLQMPAHKPGKRISIGIVSAHIRGHSVWNAIVRGWLKKIDRDQFVIHLFHTGFKRDQETDWAQEHSDSFTEQVPQLEQWVEIILSRQPDVLIYPEIGMDRIDNQACQHAPGPRPDGCLGAPGNHRPAHNGLLPVCGGF